MISSTAALAPLLGNDVRVPVFGGGVRRYINLDNAATTPVFLRVWQLLSEVMPYYGSVHRGSGFKSLVSTELFERSVHRILTFAGGDPAHDTIVFGVNTTSCINHLARRLRLDESSLVVTSEVEHSSNSLPWRKHCRVIECPSTPAGDMDLDGLEAVLKQGKISLVAVTAASNVTGKILSLAPVARIAHRFGTPVFVDASQLAGHRRIDRKSPDSEEHLDFVAFCAHKMYAPFGVGVLVGPARPFRSGWPDDPGGGNVKLIDREKIIWADLPDREQGGTPNLPGIAALAEACRVLEAVGFDAIARHEAGLLEMADARLRRIDRVNVYRRLTPGVDSIAIIPFNVSGFDHSLVGAYLGYEHAIGVRTGLFCQYSLVRRLLGIPASEQEAVNKRMAEGDMRNVYGLVRASCGIGTSVQDVDTLFESIESLAQEGTRAQYEQSADGRFSVEGFTPAYPAFVEH